ncbi:conserved Plasmodium protein, unknown function [Plasmodium ovale]|uniref:Uncharacterized protein n=1 Tax=Plasmodium ovale TaxID=36330 RepID=A0A1D3KX69_PLAOA|nr:conserved Plasmodium protein, unknown function [Plasmodium ovale]
MGYTKNTIRGCGEKCNDDFIFLSKHNRKAAFRVIANYINLSQYELARSLLHNLVVSHLLVENDFKKGKKASDILIGEKCFYLKKVLKFMRRFLPYGCSPLQILSNEISSAHFLLKVISDYNAFVDIIFLNLLQYEEHFGGKQCEGVMVGKAFATRMKETTKKKAKFRFLLRRKYIPRELKRKVSFDVLLANIVTYKSFYLNTNEDLTFSFFSIETTQKLRRVYHLFLKTREILKSDRRKLILSEFEKELNSKCYIIRLFNYIVPYNKKYTYIRSSSDRYSNVEPPENTELKRIKKKSILKNIDKLILHNLNIIYHVKKKKKKKSIVQREENQNRTITKEVKEKEGKKMLTKNVLNVIYIHPLYILHQKPIFNYVSTYEEEIFSFFEQDVMLSLTRDLFYISFYLPTLAVYLFKTLFLNRKFFDTLLELFSMSNTRGLLRKYANVDSVVSEAIEKGIDTRDVENANDKCGNKKDHIGDIQRNLNIEREICEITQSSQEKRYRLISLSYVILLEAYCNVMHIYMDVLVHKLKRNNITNYYNFIYLLKFNHLFVNNVFLFSLCSTIILLCAPVEGGANKDQDSRREKENVCNDNARNVNAHNTVSVETPQGSIRNCIPKGNSLYAEISRKQLHLARSVLNKIYDFLVMLVFYYNNDPGAVYHFGLVSEEYTGKALKSFNKDENSKCTILLNGVELYLHINLGIVEDIFHSYTDAMHRKKEKSQTNYYHSKSIIYEIFMSTNSFYSDRRIYNVFLYLYNYIDDLYVKTVRQNLLFSDIRKKGNEELLFYLNISRSRGVHFLSHLFDVCEELMQKQEFLHVDRLLHNFKGLKNICILYCLENTEDVNIKEKCLHQLRACKENMYLYNYIKITKAKVKYASLNYYFYRKNEHALKLQTNKKLTKSDVYLKLKSTSNVFFLNEYGLLQYVDIAFVEKLKKVTTICLHKKEAQVNNHFLIFYATIRSTYRFLRGGSRAEAIKKYYRLITYSECKIKAILYIFVLLFRCIELGEVDTDAFIYIIRLLHQKLRIIKNEKLLFYSKLKYILLQVVQDVYIRLFVFFEKYKSKDRKEENKKIVKINMGKGKNFHEMNSNHVNMITREVVDSRIKETFCFSAEWGIDIRQGDGSFAKSALRFCSGRRRYSVVRWTSLRSPYLEVNNDNILNRKLGNIFEKKRERQFFIFQFLTKVEDIFHKKSRYHFSKERQKFNILKKCHIKRKCNPHFEKYFYKLMFIDPHEYIYINIIDGKNILLNMFLFNRYKKDIPKNCIYNLLFYIYLNMILRKMYMNNSKLFFYKRRNYDMFLNKKRLMLFFHYISFYYDKYKSNEINRYLFRNNKRVDFFLLYNFLDTCVSFSNTVEKGVVLLKFVRSKIEKIRSQTGVMRSHNEKTPKQESNRRVQIGCNSYREMEDKVSCSFLDFLLYFVNRLHVLINIKRGKSKNTSRGRSSRGRSSRGGSSRGRSSRGGSSRGRSSRGRSNRGRSNRGGSSTGKKEKEKEKSKILLNRYLLLQCNSLKIQSKLIKKYFIDLYKKKHFLKEMFFFFNHLKKKNKKYVHISYSNMNVVLEKYCLLLLQNDEYLYINYLFFFFLFSNILIKYIHSSIINDIEKKTFYDHLYVDKKEDILNITYKRNINYNLFYLYTIDIFLIIKYILFVCKEYTNARKLCYLYFVHYYRILVENIQTQCFLTNSTSYLTDYHRSKRKFSLSFFVIKNCTNKIMYKLNFKNIYKNKKVVEKYLTDNFLLISKGIDSLKILKRQMDNSKKRKKKKKSCNLNALHCHYVDFMIKMFCNGKGDSEHQQVRYISNRITERDTYLCTSNTITTEDTTETATTLLGEGREALSKHHLYADICKDTQERNQLMSLFICLEKCDYYFPFTFNMLYGYHFSRKYTYLHKFTKERYNYTNKIFAICKGEHREGDCMLEGKYASQEKSMQEGNIKQICDIFFFKYHDLINLNSFTKSVLYASTFDNQHNIDCVHIYEVTKQKREGGEKNTENARIIVEKKLNRFYLPYFDLDKFPTAIGKMHKGREMYEYLLKEEITFSAQLDILINTILVNAHILRQLSFHQVMLALDACHRKGEVTQGESDQRESVKFPKSDEVNCDNFTEFPKDLPTNVIKLNVYLEIFKIIKRVRKVQKEEYFKSGRVEDEQVKGHDRLCWVDIFETVMKKGEDKESILNFIIANRLFKYCTFYVKFKNCAKFISSISIKCNSAYVLYLWECNKMKRKKIITFFNCLEKKRVRIILYNIFYTTCHSDLYPFFFFIWNYFNEPYIKRLCLLSLLRSYLKIEKVQKFIKYRHVISFLLKNNQLTLIDYILRANLFQPTLYTFYCHAFACIDIDLGRVKRTGKKVTYDRYKSGKIICRSKREKTTVSCNLYRCLSILKLSTSCKKGETNLEFVYSSFLCITQRLFDKICSNISMRGDGEENKGGRKQEGKGQDIRQGEMIKIRRIDEMTRERKNISEETEKVRGKFSLFYNFHRHHNSCRSSNKNGGRDKNVYIRKYRIVSPCCDTSGKTPQKVVKNNGKDMFDDNNEGENNVIVERREESISTNILIYTFYKICYFFFENYKELKCASNLLCNLLPLLMYIKFSIHFNIRMKDIIKLNIKNLIEVLKVKNYNLCNQLIHRICSCYFYNVNSFGVLNEPSLFYSILCKHRTSKKYKVIKNIVTLLRCDVTTSAEQNMWNENGRMNPHSLTKIRNFYIYSYAKRTYIYRKYADISKMIYDELEKSKKEAEQQGKRKTNRHVNWFNLLPVHTNPSQEEVMISEEVEKKQIKKVYKKFKIMNKDKITEKIQNIRFNIIAFYYEYLNKNNMHFYSTLSLFFFFFFNFHYCSNIYKIYKNLFAYFNNLYVQRGEIKNAEKINNNISITEIEIFKKIRKEGNYLKKKPYYENGWTHKNHFQPSDIAHKIIAQTDSDTYHSYIILKKDILNEIKNNRSFSERKCKYIVQNLLKCSNVIREDAFMAKRRNKLYFYKFHSANNLYCDGVDHVPVNIYSVFTSICVKKHFVNDISFAYFYNYYNNVHFGTHSEELDKIGILKQKNLFLYLIEMIKNPYVTNKRNCCNRKGNFFLNASNPPIDYLNGNVMAKNEMENLKKKNMNKSEHVIHILVKKDKLRVTKLLNKKTTFIYSNYIRQKKITHIIDTFKRKLENFQKYVNLLHNNSLENNILEFFISKELVYYYEYFFYDLNSCSYPLCFINPSNNLNTILQYFKKDINNVCENMTCSENCRRGGKNGNITKVQHFLFVTSLLLPLPAKFIKLGNYNRAKCDKKRLNNLRNYFSLANLVKLYGKYHLDSAALKLITQKNLGLEHFSYIVKRAYEYNYIYKIFQNVSSLRSTLFQHKIKCYLLKKKMYTLLYNYVIFSGDYLNAAILCIYNYGISQNIDMKNGYLNNALVNLTLIIKNLENTNGERKNSSKNSDSKIAHDNFIFRNSRKRNKRNRRVYCMSNFNRLFDELQRRENQLIPAEAIFRCIDLITLQQNLLNEQLDIQVDIINCKKMDISFCINVLIFKKIYNLADNVINVYRWEYIFTYCLACVFCLYINKNLGFLHDIIYYIKIKLSDYDMNIFILHMVYLYLEYKNKLKYMYECVQEIYEKRNHFILKSELQSIDKEEVMLKEKKEKRINDNVNEIKYEQENQFYVKVNQHDHVNTILTYINDNDFLFYSHTLIYIHNKKEYKKLFKNMKNLLFTNLNKNDIYRTILCAYNYVNRNCKKINYNFIHDNIHHFKKIKRNNLSLTCFGNISSDYNFSKILLLAKNYPDNIKKKIIREIVTIYNVSTSAVM